MLENMLTSTQAAALIGVSPSLIRRYVEMGKLPAVKMGKMHIIALADLRKFDAERPKRRHPPRGKRGSAK
jgi:excisionase family DNA binding protein